jgi:hypothetical protein
MQERVKTAIQRDLAVAGGAAAVILTYTAATDSYRVEAATEHLGPMRAAGTARVQHRVADVRAIVAACGATVEGGS